MRLVDQRRTPWEKQLAREAVMVNFTGATGRMPLVDLL